MTRRFRISSGSIGFGLLSLAVACKTAPQANVQNDSASKIPTPSVVSAKNTDVVQAPIPPQNSPTPKPQRASTRAFIEELSNSLGLSLTDMKSNLESARTESERAVALLGIAAWRMRHNNFDEAISDLEQLKQIQSNELREIHEILLAEANLRLENFDKAALAIAGPANNENFTFHKRAAVMYFQALLLAKKFSDAQEYLRKNRSAVLSSADNITLLPESFIRNPQIFSEREQLEIARRLMRDFGSQPQLRALGMKIAGIDEKKLIPNEEVDSLSLSEKERLLKAADILISSWEYPLAFKILEKLKNAKSYGEKFERVEVLMLLGRALNATERYDEAIPVYAEAMRLAKSNSQRENAQERYLLSIHFSQDFSSEAKVIHALVEKKKRKRAQLDLLWQLFWAEYLSERYNEAWKTGSLIEKRLSGKSAHSPMAHAVSYWKARMQENQDDLADARKSYKAIAAQHAESHFAILAKWRLSMLRQETSNEAPRPHIPIRQLTLPPHDPVAKTEKEEAAIALVRNLTNAGLFRFANPLFENIRFPARSKADAVGSAEKALALQKFRRAISLVEDFGTDRYSKGVSALQMSNWMLHEPKFWRSWFPLPYPSVFRAAASEYGVPEALVWSVARKESVFETTATSPVGAMGLMQIMPRTGFRIANIMGDNEFQPSDLLRPEVNIVYGSWYLHRLSDYYRGNEILAATAYNAGPAAVDRWIRQNPELELDEFLQNIPYDQTRDYVPKIIRYMDTYLRFYSGAEYVPPQSKKLPEPNKSIEIF